jgi:hypothetical protein
MKKTILTGTTVLTTGAFTVNDTRNIMGKLYAILYLPGTLDTGATIVVTCQGVFAKPLLTKATAGTADTLYYPRDLVHAVADGAALTGAAGGDRTLPLINGTLRFAVSSGGVTPLTGSVVVYYED